MKIDLRKIPVIYINLIQHTEKDKNIRGVLEECGFETIIRSEGHNRPDNPCAGNGGAQVAALSKIEPPFIVIEDDCQINNFVHEIEVPDDADVVYLGASQWGRYLNFSGPFVHYEKIDENVVRIYNMLSTHCLLYFSNDFLKIAQKIAKKATFVDRYDQESQPLFDIGVTEIQKLFNVYCMNDPLFKQSGYNEKVTSCKLTDVAMNIDQSEKFFDSVKFNLNKLQGVPDLNNAPSCYKPLRFI